MNRYTIALLLGLLLTSTPYAEIIPASMYGKVIDIAMKNFWGNAKQRDGTTVQPDSEEERKTLPINRGNAQDVIKVGEISSVAQWCGVQWQKNYGRLTKSARASGLDQKQLAFIGFLHGVTMGMVDVALEGQTCALKTKNKFEAQLQKISNEPLNWDASKRASVK